jgi:hypothetical protein
MELLQIYGGQVIFSMTVAGVGSMAACIGGFWRLREAHGPGSSM